MLLKLNYDEKNVAQSSQAFVQNKKEEVKQIKQGQPLDECNGGDGRHNSIRKEEPQEPRWEYRKFAWLNRAWQ